MKTSRPRILLAAGVAAALTCGLSPLGAAAASEEAPVPPSANAVVLGYEVTQSAVPNIAAGYTGKATVRVANQTTSNGGHGAVLRFTAPEGTTFADTRLTSVWSNGAGVYDYGTLSTDKRTLVVNWSDYVKAGYWVDLTVTLRSDADNSRRGAVGGGSFSVDSGLAFPLVLEQDIRYEAVDAFTLAQTAAPRIAPGEAGVIKARWQNNLDTNTRYGATFLVDAPEGTRFASASIALEQSDGYKASWAGVLSADRRTMTIKQDAHYLRAGVWAEISLPVVSDDGNTRTGTVEGGRLVVSGGLELPTGLSTPLAYESGYVAPQVAPVTLSAPAIGAEISDTKRPEFVGTAHPGAVVTVTAASGEVVATTTANPDGSWKASVASDLDNGAYWGTVSQSADSTTARYEFTVNVPDPVKVVTPVTLTAPALYAVIEPGKPVFAGTGNPGATVVVKGQFGTRLGTATVKADGTWEVESVVSLVAGSYMGTAVQTAGADVSSATFRFTAVANTDVKLTTPTIGAALAPGRPVFAGTGHPGATVTVQGKFGTILGTATVTTSGTWSLTSTVSLVPGSYSGFAKQTVDGKATSAPFEFTID